MEQFEYDSEEETQYDNSENYIEQMIYEEQNNFYEMITEKDTFKTFIEKLRNHQLYTYLVIDSKITHRTLQNSIKCQWNYVYENIINEVEELEEEDLVSDEE